MNAAQALTRRSILVCALFASGCATVEDKGAIRDPLDAMRTAMSCHLKGEWEESNEAIETAIRLLQRRPDFQLGSATGSLLLAEAAGRYNESGHELVTLHSLGMLNYMMLGEKSEALVEARRSDELLKAMEAGGGEFAQDPLGRYLAAKLYESEGLFDDAYIDLLKAKQGFQSLVMATGVPEPSFLGRDLYRLALKSRGEEEAARWLKAYPLAAAGNKPGSGEVWLLAWQGSLPALQAGALGTSRAFLAPPLPEPMALAGGEEARLETVCDFSALAAKANGKKGLGAGLRGLVRMSLRIALMAGLAVITGGEILKEDAAYRFMFEDPGSDLRQWDNLPARVLACRLELPPGSHDLKVVGEGTQEHDLKVKVKKGGIAMVRLVLESKEHAALSPSARP